MADKLYALWVKVMVMKIIINVDSDAVPNIVYSEMVKNFFMADCGSNTLNVARIPLAEQ